MKFATTWWGVQILAETAEDEKILRTLQASLPESTENAYEDGILQELNHKVQRTIWDSQTRK